MLYSLLYAFPRLCLEYVSFYSFPKLTAVIFCWFKNMAQEKKSTDIPLRNITILHWNQNKLLSVVIGPNTTWMWWINFPDQIMTDSWPVLLWKTNIGSEMRKIPNCATGIILSPLLSSLYSMAYYLEEVMNCTRSLLLVVSGWIPRHTIGAVLVSLPAISVLSHFSCSVHLPLQVNAY